MLLTLPDRAVNLLRALLVLTLAAGTIYYIAFSIHWPLLVDSPVMHYVRFLMDHGFEPYQTITDNNMPGSYLFEGWAMHLFGPTDLAWRFYEFFLLAVITLAMVAIARPVDWLAGVYAGGLFILLHASEGPNLSAEREEVMAALIFCAYALLFTAVRRRRPVLLLPFGFLSALAASIKPTILPLDLLVLILALVVLRRRQLAAAPYLLWALAGLAAAFSLDIGFLLVHHAVHPFLFVLRVITPAYVSLRNPGWRILLPHAIPLNIQLILPFGLLVLILHRRWNWERWALLLGASVGAFSYFAQGKGFLHHRYTLLSFLLLLLGLELLPALRRRGLARWAGAAGILVTLVVSIPHYLLTMRSISTHSELTEAMQADLRNVSGGHLENLQHQVQCFDLVFGCLNSLYHLDLVENTGYTGDLLLFSTTENAASRYYRDMFWREQARLPADVFVITNQWFGDTNTFTKLDTWPAFAQYLAANYTLVIAREFPREGLGPTTASPGGDPPSYRIYLRNGSPTLIRYRQVTPAPALPVPNLAPTPAGSHRKGSRPTRNGQLAVMGALTHRRGSLGCHPSLTAEDLLVLLSFALAVACSLVVILRQGGGSASLPTSPAPPRIEPPLYPKPSSTSPATPGRNRAPTLFVILLSPPPGPRAHPSRVL